MKIRNKKISFIFVSSIMLVLMSTGCGGRPSEVLSEKQMVDLLVDMEIADSYSSQQPSTSAEDRIELGQRVLAAHKVSRETLDTTLAWYGRNLDEYTALYEKVDAEITKRKQKYTDSQEVNLTNLANMWPYSIHQVISQNSGNDALIFSFPKPEINKGDVVRFTFAMANAASGKGMIGLDYTDGSGESAGSVFTGKNNYEIELQSDTLKTISRLYGVMYFKDENRFPIYLDSISLTLHPIDSLTYRQKKRAQKSFDMLRNRQPEEITDSVSVNDSIATDDSIRELDSLLLKEATMTAPAEPLKPGSNPPLRKQPTKRTNNANPPRKR